MNIHAKRITALREAMRLRNLSALIISSSDPHMNEYLPDMWKRREYISGFSGSAGELVVLLNRAVLWTDGRYYIQAEHELLGSGIELFRQDQPDVPSISRFLTEQLTAKAVVGIDPCCISHQRYMDLKKEVKPLKLESIEDNLVDSIWEDRPTFPRNPLTLFGIDYAGQSIEEKQGKIRKEMQKAKVAIHVVSSLSGIAWLFNIRGSDIPFNPFVLAYAIITLDNSFLFIDSWHIDEKLRNWLGKGVELLGYESFSRTLDRLTKELERRKSGKISLDPRFTSAWISHQIKEKYLVFGDSPVLTTKAVKNETEIAGMRKAHLVEGTAITRLLFWIETEMRNRHPIGEMDISDKIEELRLACPDYRGPSFTTIAAIDANSAIVHHVPSRRNERRASEDSVILIDSGAQYLHGTTDMTRTLAFGKVSDEYKTFYTAVLKGLCRLFLQIFPEGVVGTRLDSIARAALWDIHADFNHGVGHGIGAYLSVHEFPPSIGPVFVPGSGLKSGMMTSIEPGYYLREQYGIRLENVALTVERVAKKDEDPVFLGFEPLTLCPFERSTIVIDRLDQREIDWLNAYHANVYAALAPSLPPDVADWLKEKTRPL